MRGITLAMVAGVSMCVREKCDAVYCLKRTYVLRVGQLKMEIIV